MADVETACQNIAVDLGANANDATLNGKTGRGRAEAGRTTPQPAAPHFDNDCHYRQTGGVSHRRAVPAILALTVLALTAVTGAGCAARAARGLLAALPHGAGDYSGALVIAKGSAPRP